MLTSLPFEEYRRLRPQLERVHLALDQVLYQPGETIGHVYFPIDAVVSLLTVMASGAAVETGMVGREGMVGLPVFLDGSLDQSAGGSWSGARGDSRAVCQVDGDAWRLPADALLAEVGRHGQLLTLLLRYTQSALRQVAQAAACNGLHPVEARCARWLLMVGDRVSDRHFPMTQRYLAEMLGVRRASVVEVEGTLTRAGLIAHDYGHVTIVDRPGLEAAACECYSVLKLQLGGARIPRPQATRAAPRK
jgi:CRP-like cAMP-binding protein